MKTVTDRAVPGKRRHPGRRGPWTLGFFSKPSVVASGPDRGRIVKLYRPLRDKALCEEVARNHDTYVRKLRAAGILVPATSLRIVPEKGRWRIVITQDAFREDELARGLMLRSAKPGVLGVLGSLLSDTLKFQAWKRRSREAPGFHPTLRNYAVRKGRPWYFDTFPPMWGWGQKRLNGIVIAFAPFWIFRLLSLFSPGWVFRVTNEYYRDDLMLTGIVGSACRLRPDLAYDILAYGRRFLSARIRDRTLLKKVLAALARPPRLPAIWVFLRGLVGKEGRPNIR